MRVDLCVKFPTGRGWFHPGEEVEGTIDVHVQDSVAIASIMVSLQGIQ